MVLPDSDHDCSLLPFLKQLAERLEKVEQETAQLKKSLYGGKSERSKMPRVKTAEPATPEQKAATRPRPRPRPRPRQSRNPNFAGRAQSARRAPTLHGVWAH